MDQNLVEKVRDSVDILDLVKEYVPAVKRSGTSYKACCPFHQEKTPSFTINPDKGLFYCFGCQTGGDIFDFVMKIENLSFNEALRKLAERAGIDWHQEEILSEEEKARLKLYKLMDFARDFYHKQLFSERGASARNYIKSRSLTKETVEKFALGLSFFDGLCTAALKAGFTIEDLKKTGLVYASNRSDLFKNRLMFPILNHRGDTVAFGGRVLGDGMPKYLNSPDTPLFSKSRVLYALNFAAPAIRKEGRAVLLEGYMDVIAAHQAGVANCVAPLGTSFNENHVKLLKRYTDTVTVLFDPDEAGQKASKRTALILLEQGFYVTVAVLPEGLDPDEYIIKYGAEKFKTITQTGKDIITYQLDKFLTGAEAISAKEKSKFAAEIMGIISRQQDKIIKAEWTAFAANRLGIEQSILLDALKTKPAKQSAEKEAEIKPAKGNILKDFLPAEISLVRIILKYPAYITLCEGLENSPLSKTQIGVILKNVALLRKEDTDGFGLTQKLIQALPELKDFILELLVEELPQGLKPKSEIPTLLKRIEDFYLQKRYKELQQQLSSYGPGQVPLALLKEQIEIQKKLKSK